MGRLTISCLAILLALTVLGCSMETIVTVIVTPTPEQNPTPIIQTVVVTPTPRPAITVPTLTPIVQIILVTPTLGSPVPAALPTPAPGVEQGRGQDVPAPSLEPPPTTGASKEAARRELDNLIQLGQGAIPLDQQELTAYLDQVEVMLNRTDSDPAVLAALKELLESILGRPHDIGQYSQIQQSFADEVGARSTALCSTPVL